MSTATSRPPVTVIAVAGPPGSGKTSLCEALAKRLPEARRIAYDNYEKLTRQPPDVVSAWLDDGGDPDRLELSDLATDLAQLAAGKPIRDRASGAMVTAGRYVLFDTPFGRAHSRSAPFIDLLIWLEVPPDVALARKLRQFTGAFLAAPDGDSQRFVAWLDRYLANYLGIVRRACAMQRRRVKPGADLCLGAGDNAALADQVLREMEHRGLGPRLETSDFAGVPPPDRNQAR